MMTNEIAASTAEERFAAADARRDQIETRHSVARLALEDLRQAIEKEHDGYLTASAGAELDGGEKPSRTRLTELESQLPAALEQLKVLERARADAARLWRHAKADVLDAEADALGDETARRQARIHELQPQLETIQREIGEHGNWIGNLGPVKIQQLEAEARRLRSMLTEMM